MNARMFLLVKFVQGESLMKSILSLVAIAGLSVMCAPETVNAGLFCRAKSICAPVCAPVCPPPAPVCCAPAPAPICYRPAPICPPAVCCEPAPVCCTPRRGLLRRLLHCKRDCCEPICPPPAPCCAPPMHHAPVYAPAPCCASQSPMPYGYGVVTRSPHWF